MNNDNIFVMKIKQIGPFFKKCLFGTAAWRFPDPGGREGIFLIYFSTLKFNWLNKIKLSILTKNSLFFANKLLSLGGEMGGNDFIFALVSVETVS